VRDDNMESTKAAKTLGPIKRRNGQSSHCQQEERLRLRLLSTVAMGKGCMCTRDGGPAAGNRRDAGAAPLNMGWGRT
jgi:hypothetical protein